jgi:outer membrane receptor protein involved in Fe transport
LCLVCTAFFTVGAAQAAAAQQPSTSAGDRRIEGTVVDEQGLPVVGARLTLTQAGILRRSALSAADRFRLENLAPGIYDLLVEAGGFEPKTIKVDLQTQPSATVEILLMAGRVDEQIVVTASRTEQRLGSVPASVSVLSGEEIKDSPAVVADDVLRQLPTFSLFRRTSSLSSHPTAQGVSLRGIGPSGVSRTLVLLDGVPFNDPFGGWVYWTRVPLETADRIEMVDGSTSNLYGNYAMGGVINILTDRPTKRTLELKPQYGNLNSPKLDFFGSDVWGKLGVAVEGSVFSTDGFPIVVENERGKVDNNATVDFSNFNVKADYNASSSLNAFVRAGYFRENRDNGKMSTIDGTEEANSTRWTNVSGGVRSVLPDQSTLQVRAYGDFERFRSNFLAVPAATPPRSIGRMTLNQLVPTTGTGASAEWSRAFGSKQVFSAGMDWHWVDGDSQEDGLDAITGTQVVLKRVSGGTQNSIGAFVQDLITPTANLTLTLSARVDHWRNYDGHNLENNYPSGTPTANNKPTLPERSDDTVSPHVGALYRLSELVSVWGAYNSGFRAPTLNELYRQFRVGTVLTLANETLGPERLFGGEAGVNVAVTRDLTFRFTWFDNYVDNPVSNVTLTQVGANVTQQRQNLGRTHIQGFQTDAEYHLGKYWRVSGAYLFNQALVTEADKNPTLVGKTLPQVPKNRGSFQVAYSNPKYINVALNVLGTGTQFDDDQNVRVVPGYTDPGLPPYGVVDLMVSRAITPNFDAFFGMQNMFNQEYFVGTLPTTIGSPRLYNGGVRIRFTGK